MSSPPDKPVFDIPGAKGVNIRRFHDRAMACDWEIRIVGEDPAYARQAAHAAFQEIKRLEQDLSRFIPHSDVSRIASLAAGQSTRVSVETCECLELAGRIQVETGGAFDVTYRSAKTAQVTHPPAASTNPAQPSTLLANRLLIERAKLSVTALTDGVKVDLGGIAKGYAIDQAVGVLREWSISTALIHAGQSTVYVFGDSDETGGWTLAIRDPITQQATLGSVKLNNQALSGSGALLHDHHILDPRTAKPAARAVATWALTPTAATADALSTAFMILTPEEVAAYCSRHPEVSAMLCLGRAERGKLRWWGPGFTSFAGQDD
ncbi:MAG: FAD:protein FMN transferase [Planctomycetota bacterium]